MTGLADAYQDDVGALQGRTRLQAGVGLLGAGTLLALLALLAALFDPTGWGARRLAGVFVGLAAPALAGGAVVILPANPQLRAAAAIGASLTLLGVAGFWHAYPAHWMGHGQELTPYVALIYGLGMLTIAVCLFAGIATFKRRNDPGGTVSLEVGPGETRVVEVDSGSGGSSALGGIGLLGGTPDGSVETQTNRSDRSGGSGATSAGTTTAATGSTASTGSTAGTGSASRTTSRSSRPGAGSTPGPTGGIGAVSDGGSGAETLESPEPLEDAGASPSATRSGGSSRADSPSSDLADRYCGNCEHFQYVRTERGMTPYCGMTSEYMEDMEACEDWSPNAGR